MSSDAIAAVPTWAAAIRAVSRAFGVFAAGLILLSIGVICQMVFVRAVLGESSIWQTEFVTFAIIAATFLGAPYILITRGHVAVDVVPLMVTQPTRRVMHFGAMLIALLFCAFFLWGALPWWYETFQSGQTTPSIWHPRVWFAYATVPIGLTLLCLEIIAEMVLVASGRQLPFGLSPEDKL